MRPIETSELSAPTRKAEWRAPRLEELGNLRSFVRSGNAFGKSGGFPDGCSNPGGETRSDDLMCMV
jgi:hypothetical protein